MHIRHFFIKEEFKYNNIIIEYFLPISINNNCKNNCFKIPLIKTLILETSLKIFRCLEHICFMIT